MSQSLDSSSWQEFLCSIMLYSPVYSSVYYTLLYSALPQVFHCWLLSLWKFSSWDCSQSWYTFCAPIPFYCVSLPVPPLLSQLHVLQVLCDQFLFFSSSPLCRGCLLFFCACLVSAFSSNISFLLYFTFFFFILVTSASSSVSSHLMGENMSELGWS